MFTITINGITHEIKANLTSEDQDDLKFLGCTFKDVTEAQAMLGHLVPDLIDQIEGVNNQKEEVRMEKTKAVYVQVSNNIGWWITKEYLLSTGCNSDAKFVKDEPYEVSFVEFVAKCSKTVREAQQQYLAKKLEEKIEKIPSQLKAKEEDTVKGSSTKAEAVKWMMAEMVSGNEGLISAHMGEKWGQWLASFVGMAIKKETAEKIHGQIVGGKLFMFVDREIYGQDRTRWNQAFEVVKNSCRGSKLEYMPTTNGKIPFKIRGERNSQSI